MTAVTPNPFGHNLYCKLYGTCENVGTMTRVAQDIAKGLSVAFVLFLLCIAIRPAGLAAHDGLSYFGSFKTTIIPYSTAFFLTAYFYWKAARKLVNSKTFRPSF